MQQGMRELIDRLNDYAYAYYVLDAPKVSDKEYDELFDELLRLEADTGIVLPDSPTLRVGGEPVTAFEQHTHIERLWSLDKIRSREELVLWMDRSDKLKREFETTPAIRFRSPSMFWNISSMDLRLTLPMTGESLYTRQRVETE